MEIICAVYSELLCKNIQFNDVDGHRASSAEILKSNHSSERREVYVEIERKRGEIYGKKVGSQQVVSLFM